MTKKMKVNGLLGTDPQPQDAASQRGVRAGSAPTPNGMKNTHGQFQNFVESVRELCSHVSVRDDENGSYIFALGRKDTHTLQLRRVEQFYFLQLWFGRTAEAETLVDEPSFPNIDEAFAKAKEWLLKDAI